MIELKDIKFSYNKGKSLALSDVSGTIGEGLYLLAGENGAGKTTLLHIIAGLAIPGEGKCTIDGVESGKNRAEYNGKVFLLEENMFFPGKTINEFARIHSIFYPTFSPERFRANLGEFGLTGDEKLRSLSLGNRKKAQLAYVLALGIEVVLLDEPTNALDIEGRNSLRKLLVRSVHEGQTVIVSTHTIGDLERLFEGAVIMQSSRILFAGTEDDVTAKLSFNSDRSYRPEALYSENNAGRYMSISRIEENDNDGSTRVDWRMLYMALHAPHSQDAVMEILQ
ncbi:MAG: ABC transporter ATP-binding protein [Clostridiales bacterium]|nr:ABC transporter ATP-binding protein [Clostridiales bacterium]